MADVVSEIAESLVGLFSRLFEINTNPALMSQENVDAVTKEILNISTNPFSIAAYIKILREVEEENIRFYAAVTMHSAFKQNWVGIEDLGVRAEYLNQFFNILPTEASIRVSKNVMNRIANIVLANAEFFPRVVQFVKNSLESGVPQQLSLAIELMGYTAPVAPEGNELAEFINTVATTAFGLNDIDITLSAFNMVYKYYVESQAERNEGIDTIWAHSVEVLVAIFGDDDHTNQLTRIMSDPLELGADFAEIEGFLPVLLELFNKEECTPDSALCYMRLIDALCAGYPEFMASQESLFDIYNRYCLVASTNFDASEHLNDIEFDMFETIVSCMSENQEVVEQWWAAKDSLLESAEGQTTILLFIKYSLEGAYDFYEDNLDDVVDIITNFLSDENVPVRDAAIAATIEFSTVFSAALDDYVEVIIAPLYESLQAEVTFDVIGAVITILENTSDTDFIFEQSVELFFGLIEAVEDQSIREQLIRATAALSKNSNFKVAQYAEQVFTSVQPIIEAEPESEIYALKGSAIDVICSLLRKCPQFFTENAGDIATFLIQCMQDEDDDGLVNDAINSFGTMVTVMPKSIEGTIEAALEVIPVLASKDMSQELVNLTTVLIDTAVSGGEDGAGELEADNQILLSQDRLEIPGAACLLYSTILSTYPPLVGDHIGNIIDCISNLGDSITSDSVSFALRSCTYVFEAIQAAELLDPEIIGRLQTIIQKAFETDKNIGIVGDALESFAAMISCIGLEATGEFIGTILELLKALCDLNLPCFDGHTEIPEELYVPIKIMFRELFMAFGEAAPEPLLAIIHETILPMLEKSSEQAFFAIAIITKWVEFSTPTVPAEVLPQILEATLNVQSKCVSYEGFYLIKILAQKVPQLIAEHIEPVLELFKLRIQQKQKRSEGFVKMMDFLVSALGAIAINVMTDSFPAEFYPIALQLMPARVELSEDVSMFEFFFFIAPRYQDQEALASVLIRLFTMPQKNKFATELSDETIELLKQTLLKLLEGLDAEALITKVCEEDAVKIEHVNQWIQ